MQRKQQPFEYDPLDCTSIQQPMPGIQENAADMIDISAPLPKEPLPETKVTEDPEPTTDDLEDLDLLRKNLTEDLELAEDNDLFNTLLRNDDDY